MKPPHWLLSGLASLVLLSTATAQPKDVIAWLASLKLDDLPADDAPIVCVPVSSLQAPGEPWRMGYAFGFLEHDDGTNYSVRLVNFDRVKGDRNRWKQQGIALADVVRKFSPQEAAQEWCRWLDTESNEDRQLRTGMQPGMEESAQMIVLAAVLQRRGQSTAADLLRKRAPKVLRHGGGKPPDAVDFERNVKEEVAKGLLASARSDFGNTEVDRKQLAQRLAQIAQHFGHTKTGAEAGDCLVELRKVLAQEDRITKHPLDEEALAKLPVKERVAALIEQLPEQTGQQMSVPGRCDIFWDDFAFRKTYVTPAAKLYKIGLPAVPQLLESIYDRRPSRAVGLTKVSGQRSNALEVGDCVIQILERISGRWFGSRQWIRDPDQARAVIQRNAEAWWAEVQAGSETEVLDRGVSAGGLESIHQARRLAEIDPERVAGAIERGLAQAKESWEAEGLVRELAMIDSVPARALLKKTITKGRFLMERMTAAEFAGRSGRISYNGKHIAAFPEEDQRLAHEAMAKEWNNFPTSAERHNPFDGGRLADLLARLAAQDLSLLAAIQDSFPRHLPDDRARFIHGLVFHKPTPEKRLEEFLAARLEEVAFAPDIDFSKAKGASQSRGARVADLAAHLLHELWPDRYPFTWDASPDEIEKARLTCLNAWRTSHQLPPVTPAPPLLGENDDPSTVTRITLGQTSKPLPPALQTQVDAWLKKPLRGESLVSFLVGFAEQNADDHRSIRLTATRDTARSGFAIEISSGAELEPTANGNFRLDVLVGTGRWMGSSGGMELKWARNPELSFYVEFKSAIARALEQSPSTFVFIQAVRLAQPAAQDNPGGS